MPWATSLGFIRVATNRHRDKSAIGAGCGRAGSPAGQDRERHGEILFRLLTELGAAGNLTSDAHLAALAIEYQAEIVSTDADFSRFPGLRWFNPLAARWSKSAKRE
jgi:predicted nucleic acid-binding protein